MKIFSKYVRSYGYARATQLYGCIATECLLDTSPPSLKTHFHAHSNNHVTSHVTHMIDE